MRAAIQCSVARNNDNVLLAGRRRSRTAGCDSRGITMIPERGENQFNWRETNSTPTAAAAADADASA